MQTIKPKLLALAAAALITVGEIIAFAINTHPPLRLSEMDEGSAQASTPFLQWKSI
jgi:hypothetical protein